MKPLVNKKQYSNKDIRTMLESRFPWLLDSDMDANGGDTVDAIAEWYKLAKELEK